MKMKEFKFKFHWNLFQESNWQWASSGLCNGLVPNRQQAITCINADLVPWHIVLNIRSLGRPRPPINGLGHLKIHLGCRPKTFAIKGYMTWTKVNNVKCVQHITSTVHSVLTGSQNLPPLVVGWANRNFHLFLALMKHICDTRGDK